MQGLSICLRLARCFHASARTRSSVMPCNSDLFVSRVSGRLSVNSGRVQVTLGKFNTFGLAEERPVLKFLMAVVDTLQQIRI